MYFQYKIFYKIWYYCKTVWLFLKPFRRFISRLIVQTSSIVTIIGAPLIYIQLHEINAQPNIRINFYSATSSSIPHSLDTIGPIYINLMARNSGEKVSPYWRASLVFCKDINIINVDPLLNKGLKDNYDFWIKGGENYYSFQSTKAVPPNFKDKLNFYSYDLDGIGSFTITASNKNNSDLSKPISIAQVTISGDYPNPTNYLVKFIPNKGFIYENLIDSNGRMIKGYGSTIKDCFDFIDPDHVLE